jgi:myo-inositol-1(or 4)-monophosphatase
MEGTPAFTERVAFGLRVARTAGDVLMDLYGELQGVESKGDIDFVTEADRQSEDYLRDSIGRSWPNDGILAEEEGESPASGSGYRWIIDPLDGTTNFLHGYTDFCVSIGLERRGRVLFGCVVAPYRDEVFHATRGGGAFRNGVRIHVSRVTSLSGALLCTGFPYNRREIVDELLEKVRRALMTSHGFRRSGSAALDLCNLAVGRLDGFWEQGLKAWDLAAGSLIVTEAGGSVTGFDGGTHDLFGGRTLASNESLRALLFEGPGS